MCDGNTYTWYMHSVFNSDGVLCCTLPEISLVFFCVWNSAQTDVLVHTHTHPSILHRMQNEGDFLSENQRTIMNVLQRRKYEFHSIIALHASNRIYHSCCICIRYSHYFFVVVFVLVLFMHCLRGRQERVFDTKLELNRIAYTSDI